MKDVSTSVGVIADDSKQLGGEIQVVDSAMKKVKSSNKNMVDNMKQVQDIMVTIKESVTDSENTTTTMLSKYEETARNVVKIESVVGKLVEELGAGGFMSLSDVAVGMKVQLMEQGSKREYHTEVADVQDEKVMIEGTSQGIESFLNENTGKKKYEVHIAVNNALYVWNDIQIGKREKNGYYKLVLEGNPKVLNRRKYPRLAMTNACEISLKSKNKTYSGRPVNIRAGGFAFACRAQEFAEAVGEVVQIAVHDFELLNGKELTGIIIRSSDNNGSYIVGCRMPEDNVEIMNYVKKRIEK